MNILMINPPIRLNNKPRHIPHGLAILANIIRKRFTCKICFVDWNAHRYSNDEIERIIKENSCDIAMIGGLIPTYKYLIMLAQIIKKYHPHSKILAGGSAAMSVPELLLNNSLVDIVCTGEGELVSVELIELFMRMDTPNLSNVKGIAYKNADGEISINEPSPLTENLDLDSDLPAYDLLPMEIYLANPTVGPGRDIDFISGRGCPYNCTFCYQPWGRKNRRHSAEFLKEAILFLKSEYEINFVSFQDDLFIADRKRLYEFCEIRNKYFSDIYWACTGRANLCDEDLIRTVRASGCTVISYGFESGSPKMLKSMKKGTTVEQMETVVALNRKYGLPIPASFILGLPGENRQTCKETVDFCIRNNLKLDSLMFASPYPGTELFEFAIKTGKINENEIHDFVMRIGDARDFQINLTDDFTDRELRQQFGKMVETAAKNYRPVPKDQLQSKIESLYGLLAKKFFMLSSEDQAYLSSHGGLNVF